MENNLFNQSINYNLKKDGIMSDAVAHNDSSCQFINLIKNSYL